MVPNEVWMRHDTLPESRWARRGIDQPVAHPVHELKHALFVDGLPSAKGHADQVRF